MKYAGNLANGGSSNTTNGSDNNDDLVSVDFKSSSKNLSLDIDHLVITFNTAVTQNGLTSGSTIDLICAIKLGFLTSAFLRPLPSK